MDKAIQKSIAGGYKSSEFPGYRPRTGTLSYRDYEKGGAYSVEQMKWSDILLDPSFWSSLGKSLGWADGVNGIRPDWYTFWHRFIDHLAEGKDIDSYFTSLFK